MHQKFMVLAKKCPGARPFVAKFKLQKNNNYLDIIHEIALQIVHEFLTGESVWDLFPHFRVRNKDRQHTRHVGHDAYKIVISYFRVRYMYTNSLVCIKVTTAKKQQNDHFFKTK